ncbi:MAG: hypothetical protein RSD08_00815 [Oscillospiraceae bacterium]
MIKPILKKCLIFTLVVFMLSYISYAIRMKGGMSMDFSFLLTLEFWVGVLLSLIGAGVVFIVGCFNFLKHVPEKTYEKIDKLINARLSNETTNHNTMMQGQEGLAVKHEVLSKEHLDISKDIQFASHNVAEIKSTVFKLNEAEIRKENEYKNLNDEQKNISVSIKTISTLGDEMTKLKSETVELQNQNKKLINEAREAELNSDFTRECINRIKNELTESKETILELKAELKAVTLEKDSLKEKARAHNPKNRNDDMEH